VSKIKILAIADIHDDFEAFAPETLPAADLCLIAGDLTNYGKRGEWQLQEADAQRILREWPEALALATWQGNEMKRAKAWIEKMALRYPTLWIPGNHDIGVDNATFGSIPGCTGILQQTVEFHGFRLYGVSMCPCYDAPFLAAQWDYMTADPVMERAAYDFEPVDIVVSHCPPFACLDSGGSVPGGGSVPIGSRALLDYIRKHAPRLVICGHVHEARGYARIGRTEIVNVAATWRIIEIEPEVRTSGSGT
jgi:Icc-related predicted phosphoesterase